MRGTNWCWRSVKHHEWCGWSSRLCFFLPTFGHQCLFDNRGRHFLIRRQKLYRFSILTLQTNILLWLTFYKSTLDNFMYQLKGLQKLWTCHEGDCALDLRSSLYSLPWVYLKVSRLPAASLITSVDRWARHWVSFTRPTSRAPPPRSIQGHSSANRTICKVYFLRKMAWLGYLVWSVKHAVLFPSRLSRLPFTFWTWSWSAFLSIWHLGM